MRAATKARKRINAGKQLATLLESAAGWPTIFNRDEPKPLAVGIHTQLIAALPAAPKTAIRAFLRFWTDRRAYHIAVASGGLRVNLDGSPAGKPDRKSQINAAKRMREQDEGKKRKVST